MSNQQENISQSLIQIADQNQNTLETNIPGDDIYSNKNFYERTLGTMNYGSIRGGVLIVLSASIGPSFLIVPYSFRNSGIILCFLSLLICFSTSVLSYGLLMRSCTRINKLLNYSDLIKHVLGDSYQRLTEILVLAFALCCIISSQVILTDIIAHIYQNQNPDIKMRSIINGILFFVLLIFCIQKDLKKFNFVGLMSFISVLFLCIVIFIQFNDYNSHFSQISNEPIKYFDLNKNFFKSFGLHYFLFFAYSVYLEVQKNTNVPSRRRLLKVFFYPSVFEMVLVFAYGCLAYVSLREWTPENILERPNISSGNDFIMKIAKAMFCIVLLFYIPVNFCPGRNALSQMIFKDLNTHSKLTVLMLLFCSIVSIIFPKVTNIISLASGTFGIGLGLLLPVRVYLKTHASLKTYKRYALIFYTFCVTSLALSSAIFSQFY